MSVEMEVEDQYVGVGSALDYLLAAIIRQALKDLKVEKHARKARKFLLEVGISEPHMQRFSEIERGKRNEQRTQL